MWSGKFVERYGINGYDVLITGDKNILEYDAYKTKVKEIYEMKLLNNTYYTDMILAQEDTVYFQVIEEVNTKTNEYGDAIQVWMKKN